MEYACHIQTFVPASAEMLFASLTRWGTHKFLSYSQQPQPHTKKGFQISLNILGDICIHNQLPGVTGEVDSLVMNTPGSRPKLAYKET
jgi:hypothetical protein